MGPLHKLNPGLVADVAEVPETQFKSSEMLCALEERVNKSKAMSDTSLFMDLND
jgi:hypothetical protein